VSLHHLDCGSPMFKSARNVHDTAGVIRADLLAVKKG
jgi:hypothetical protein